MQKRRCRLTAVAAAALSAAAGGEWVRDGRATHARRPGDVTTQTHLMRFCRPRATVPPIRPLTSHGRRLTCHCRIGHAVVDLRWRTPLEKGLSPMARSALIVVDTPTSDPRWFRCDNGSPELVVPHVADFYTWAVEQQIPLSAPSYERFAADRNRMQPRGEVDAGDPLPPDIHFLYRLTLGAPEYELRLQVFNCSTRRARAVRAAIETLTHDTLYDSATRWCDMVAHRYERWAAIRSGTPVPGADPQYWIGRATAFRARQPGARRAADDTHDADPETVYTVIGVWHDDTPVPVGVIAGDHEVSEGDSAAFEPGVWATSVSAPDTTTAQRLAVTQMRTP